MSALVFVLTMCVATAAGAPALRWGIRRDRARAWRYARTARALRAITAALRAGGTTAEEATRKLTALNDAIRHPPPTLDELRATQRKLVRALNRLRRRTAGGWCGCRACRDTTRRLRRLT